MDMQKLAIGVKISRNENFPRVREGLSVVGLHPILAVISNLDFHSLAIIPLASIAVHPLRIFMQSDHVDLSVEY